MNTTNRDIDQIDNNTGTDIVLNPINDVKVNSLTANRALQAGSLKEIESSAVTNTELGYVSGVTSSIQTQINSKEPLLPNTTDGDMLYYDGGQTRLPIGTAKQYLNVNGSGLPEWESLPLTSKGDIFTYDTDNARLPVGTNGHYLSADSAEATGLKWTALPPFSPTTTEGDLIIRNATEDVRLPIGTNNQVLTSNGTTASWETPTSGGSGTGGFNYIENGTAETDTAGWTVYKNTTVGTKPDDFGGTPSGSVTWTRSTVSPLVGAASFLLTKDAANRQGEGIYYEFTAEEGHKTLKLLLAMITDTTNANITDSTMGLYLVGSNDNFVADFLVIEPNNPALLAGNPQIFKQIQLNADKTKYRFCIHIASTDALAYTAKFDSLVFGPSSLALGALITDWVAFTPTMTNLTVGNGVVQAFYKRSGDSVAITYNIQFGTTTSISSGISLAMPTGLVIDATKVPSSTSIHTNNSVTLLDSDNTANRQQGAIRLVPGSNIIQVMTANESQVSTTVPFTWATSDRIMFTVTDIPVTGWSSNAVSSEDLGGREIISAYGSNATQSIGGTATILQFNTKGTDTTSAVTTGASWKFTAPESGEYDVSGVVQLTTTSAFNGTTERAFIGIYKNGAAYNRVSSAGSNINVQVPASASNNIYLTYATKIQLNKGDYFDLRASQESGSNHDFIAREVSIQKLASPQTILETETVAARYTSNSGQAISTSITDIKYEDLVADTHSAYNVSTGVYTVPISGFYSISAKYETAFTVWAAGGAPSIYVYVNGVSVDHAYFRVISAVTAFIQTSINTSIYLNKGASIVIRGDSSTATTMTAGSTRNTFAIARIK